MTSPRRAPGWVAGVSLGVVMLVVALGVALFVGRGVGTDSAGSSLVVPSGGSQTVDVQLGDMTITPKVITVTAGTTLTLNVVNVDRQRHDLYIDGGPATPLLAPGGTATLQVGPITRSMAGWCTVPGHRQAGMTMSIQVADDASTGAAGTTAAPGSGMPGMPGMPGTTGMPGATGGTGGTGAAGSPAIDFQGKPGPDWKPYDPSLTPAPGGTTHTLTFTVRDTPTEVAPGVRQTLWTYNGTAPGPILHGKVGDLFVVTLVNDGTMDHSIDFHAGSVSPDEPMRSIAPGESLVYEFRADYSGAWLYHCATMPMSLHIANGMYGAVIIDPPDLDPVAREFVFVQGELYLGPQGGIADMDKINARTPDAFMFNGYVNQYVNAPIQVKAGERIRVWVVDAGPEFGTSFHVVGAQFTAVFKEGAYLLQPNNPQHGAAQALDLAPAQGGFVEFTLAAPGHYTFLDHAAVDAEHGARGVFVAS